MFTRVIVNAFKTFYNDFRLLLKREINFYYVNPKVSTLYLTYRCNSKCKTCTMWQRPYHEEIQKEIDLKKWKIVINKLAEAGIKTTEIFGGNVLLRKELLIPVLQYLHEKGIAVHFPTNQIGLDDDIAKAIVKYVDTIYVSTDGLGGDQDEIRGIKGAYSVGEDSIEKILRLRSEIEEECNCTRIVCNCTVSRFNYDNIDGMVLYAINRGFDEIHFEYAGEFEKNDVEMSTILDVTPDPHYVRQESSILVDKEQAIRLKQNIEAIKKMYKKSNIVIGTLNIESLSVNNLWRGTIPHKKCYVERNEITIDPYGNLVACPFINNYIIGSLLDSSLKDIWNNEKHVGFRKIQNAGGLPMCRHCILGVQRNPGVMKSLHRIYLFRIKPYLS